MYEAMWGMTLAQIELMACDKPVTFYDKRGVDDEDVIKANEEYAKREAAGLTKVSGAQLLNDLKF